MEVKLNIYSREKDEKGNRIISKTYTADSYDLLYGTVEDVLNLFDVVNINDENEIIRLINKAKNQVNDLMKDVFFGLTDDELKMVSIKEVAMVLVEITKYGISGLASEVKNAMRG